MAGNRGFRSEFTEEQDMLLMKYIACYNPAPQGRCGNLLYEKLVANDEGKWPWARHHTWQSWRERYRKNQDKFDYKIRVYQKKKGIEVSQKKPGVLKAYERLEKRNSERRERIQGPKTPQRVAGSSSGTVKRKRSSEEDAEVARSEAASRQVKRVKLNKERKDASRVDDESSEKHISPKRVNKGKQKATLAEGEQGAQEGVEGEIVADGNEELVSADNDETEGPEVVNALATPRAGDATTDKRLSRPADLEHPGTSHIRDIVARCKPRISTPDSPLDSRSALTRTFSQSGMSKPKPTDSNPQSELPLSKEDLPPTQEPTPPLSNTDAIADVLGDHPPSEDEDGDGDDAPEDEGEAIEIHVEEHNEAGPSQNPIDPPTTFPTTPVMRNPHPPKPTSSESEDDSSFFASIAPSSPTSPSPVRPKRKGPPVIEEGPFSKVLTTVGVKTGVSKGRKRPTGVEDESEDQNQNQRLSYAIWPPVRRGRDKGKAKATEVDPPPLPRTSSFPLAADRGPFTPVASKSRMVQKASGSREHHPFSQPSQSRNQSERSVDEVRLARLQYYSSEKKGVEVEDRMADEQGRDVDEVDDEGLRPKAVDDEAADDEAIGEEAVDGEEADDDAGDNDALEEREVDDEELEEREVAEGINEASEDEAEDAEEYHHPFSQPTQDIERFDSPAPEDDPDEETEAEQTQVHEHHPFTQPSQSQAMPFLPSSPVEVKQEVLSSTPAHASTSKLPVWSQSSPPSLSSYPNPRRRLISQFQASLESSAESSQNRPQGAPRFSMPELPRDRAATEKLQFESEPEVEPPPVDKAKAKALKRRQTFGGFSTYPDDNIPHIDLADVDLATREREAAPLSRPSLAERHPQRLSDVTSRASRRDPNATSIRLPTSPLPSPRLASDQQLVKQLGTNVVLEAMVNNHGFPKDVVKRLFEELGSLQETDDTLRRMREAAEDVAEDAVRRKSGSVRFQQEENGSPSHLAERREVSREPPQSRASKSGAQERHWSVESDAIEDDYVPPSTSRARQFKRLVQHGRKADALRREWRRSNPPVSVSPSRSRRTVSALVNAQEQEAKRRDEGMGIPLKDIEDTLTGKYMPIEELEELIGKASLRKLAAIWDR